jgi:phosphoacetylglucosamine mutase
MPSTQELTVDCANGVGAPKLAALASALEPAGLRLQLRATGDGELNGGCGSDFVQKERALPAHFGRVEPGARWGRKPMSR